jgi:hypothetical protein
VDDIATKSRISAISEEGAVLSHKVNDKNPQGELPGYRRKAPDKPPETSAPVGEENEEERHLVDIIV